jgi:hypothetical protein
VSAKDSAAKTSGQLDDSTLWTVEDLMTWAQVSKSWVYQKAAAGLLPCIKLGGLLRFEPAAIKRFFLSGGVAQRKVIPLNPKTPTEGR